MFLGYLRSDFENSLEELINNKTLFEIELLKQTYKIFPQYCFAAYEDNNIVAVLSAYEFNKYLYVNVIEVLDSNENLIQRLLNLLIKNSSNKNIFFLLNNSYKEYLNENIFKADSSFVRYVHSGEPVAFNFSNSMAKQVNSEDYETVMKKIDNEVFNDIRDEYISKDAVFSNSLKLSTTAGSLHSYVVNKRYIKISPWLMKSQAFMDAEKLLRGVLYYRGLKKIFAYAPLEVKEIIELYESYKFKKDEEFILFYMGEKPNLKLENLYAI